MRGRLDLCGPSSSVSTTISRQLSRLGRVRTWLGHTEEDPGLATTGLNHAWAASTHADQAQACLLQLFGNSLDSKGFGRGLESRVFVVGPNQSNRTSGCLARLSARLCRIDEFERVSTYNAVLGG
jgi:hypothetical protein